MQRYILQGAHTKDFSHLLSDYKVARRAASAAGGAGGGGGRGRGRSFRPGEFDPNAEDRDNDGNVQDGTRFERPAAPSAAVEAARAAVSPEKLTSGFRRRRRVEEPATEVSSDMEDQPNPRARRLLGQIRRGRGVPVRQPGRTEPLATSPNEPTRAMLREERARRRIAGERLDRIGQRLFVDFSKKQRSKALEKTLSRAPWLKSWLKKEQIVDSDDQMRYVMDWMKGNALEAARKAGMLDNNDNLTEDAIKAGRWYEVAHDLANELADEVDIPPEAIYAVLAMFSAKTAWPNNVASALAAVRRMQENPILDDEYAAKIHRYRLGARLSTAKDKLKAIPPKEKKEILLALRDNEKLTDAQKKLIPPEFQYLVDDIIKIANLTPRDFVEQELGGVMGARLRDQPKTAGGFMIKMAELDSFPLVGEKEGPLGGSKNKEPDFRVRGVDFEVEADGSYAIKYTTSAGNTQHSPEKEHADAFEILQEAFGNKDMTKIMNLIDENLGEGSKIRSFYNNIADPNDKEFQSATIDTHMGAQMMGVPVGGNHKLINDGLFSTLGNDPDGLGAPFMYPIMAEVIYEIAQEWGVSAREAQSILWEAQRGLWNWASTQEAKNTASKNILQFIKENTKNGEAEFTPSDLMAEVWNQHENMEGNPKARDIYKGEDNGLMPRSIPRVS